MARRDQDRTPEGDVTRSAGPFTRGDTSGRWGYFQSVDRKHAQICSNLEDRGTARGSSRNSSAKPKR